MKPSIYLKTKAEALYNSLDYMIQSSGSKSIVEKTVVFLAQIDFWDWEMEELIFSFKNFEERSKVWDSTDVNNLLSKNNFAINKKTISKLQDLFYSKDFAYRIYGQRREKVVAPYEILNKTIKKWNDVLDECKHRLMKNPEEFGIQCDNNIDRFKKELINII